MRKLKTFVINKKELQDLSNLHGINAEAEIRSFVDNEIDRNGSEAILVTEEEYNYYTNDLFINPNDFTPRTRRLMAKIIGIKQKGESIKVVNTYGKHIETLKNKGIFAEKYFIDIL